MLATRSVAAKDSIKDTIIKQSLKSKSKKTVRMVRPRSRANHYYEDEALHTSKELEAVHQKSFGRVMELEKMNELPDNADGLSTGQPTKCMGDVKEQCPLHSAIKIREATRGITNALKYVVLPSKMVSGVTTLAASNKARRAFAIEQVLSMNTREA